MKIDVIINDEKRVYLVNETVKHRAISRLRERIKTNYKQQNKECNLWFINIKT